MKKILQYITGILLFLLINNYYCFSQYNKDSVAKYEKYGNEYFIKKDFKTAVKYYELGFRYATGNDPKLRDICNWLASCYTELAEYEKSRTYYEKGLEYSISFDKKLTVFNAFVKIGDQYYGEKRYENARANYLTAIDISADLTENERLLNKANINLCIKRIENIDEILKQQKENIHVEEINQNSAKYENLAKIYMDSLQFTKLFSEEAKKIIDSIYIEVENKRDSIKKLDDEIAVKEQVIIEKDSKLHDTIQKLNSTIVSILILSVLLIIIFILAIIASKNYRKQKHQNILLEAQKNEIQQQAEELRQILENLQRTQKQLIQSEKMASLGQLIAGIAHELNTPLGAIKSSINTVNASIPLVIKLLPDVITKLNYQEFELFTTMLQQCISETNYYTSRELRQLKKDIKKKLDTLLVLNVEEITDNLIDIKLYNNYEQYLILLQHDNQKLIFETAYNIINQQVNSNNIQTAVESASKIIFALKSYSHSTNTEEKLDTNINQNIENVLTIYYNQLKHGIKLNKDFGDIPNLMAYPDQLNQIWINLISNAIQAMNSNGELKISTRFVNNKIVVAFKDTGKGIPEEIQERIFDPFFTTKAQGEGTGLGLDIVKKLVTLHNGNIYFETKIDVGTTFIVELAN